MNTVSLLLSLLSLCATEIHAFVPSSSVRATTATKIVRNMAPIDVFDHQLLESANSLWTAVADTSSPDYIPGTSGEVTYSKASYYVILGLYLTSFPGLWSTIKRSTKAKLKKKTFVSKGANAEEGQGLREHFPVL